MLPTRVPPIQVAHGATEKSTTELLDIRRETMP